MYLDILWLNNNNIIIHIKCGDKIYQGGGVAAPIASQVLGEVLPYMQIAKSVIADDEIKKVLVPNIEGMTISEATKVLEELNLVLDNSNNKLENDVITEQIPIPNVEVIEGSNIIAK